MKESREIYRDHRCEILFRILGERLGDEDASVVDKRIYSPEALGSHAQNAFGRLRAGNVTLDHQDRRIVALAHRTRTGDHLIADLPIGFRQLRADAAGRSGDDDDFSLGCHVRSFSWSRVYPSEKMHQRTECGFASVAQLLSSFAAGSAAIKPTLRRYCAGVRPVASRNARVKLAWHENLRVSAIWTNGWSPFPSSCLASSSRLALT